MSKIALFKTKSFQILFLIALVVGIGIAFALDTDNDGMSDVYENFFKLNPTNSSDAAQNHDSDLLDNLAESELWTNPDVADTDCDGFPDHADSNALSRAVVFWGHPDFTSGDDYSYPGPGWWVDAYKVGGVWSPSNFWHLAAGETGSLCMTVDPGMVTNNLVLDLLFDDTTDSVVQLRLLDENSAVLSNLVADITSGTGEQVLKQYAIPLTAFTNASRISVTGDQNAGEFNMYSSILYIDQDGDGLDANQEQQAGTLDTNPDYDGDGFNDYTETVVLGTDPLGADGGGEGGGTDEQPVNVFWASTNLAALGANPDGVTWNLADNWFNANTGTWSLPTAGDTVFVQDLSLEFTITTQPVVGSQIQVEPRFLFIGWDVARTGTLSVVDGGSLSAQLMRLGNGLGGLGTLNMGGGLRGSLVVAHRLEIGYNLVVDGSPMAGGDGVVNMAGRSTLHAGSLLFGQEAVAYGQFPETVGEGVVNMADGARLMVNGDLVADGRAANWISNGWIKAVDERNTVFFRYDSENNRTEFILIDKGSVYWAPAISRGQGADPDGETWSLADNWYSASMGAWGVPGTGDTVFVQDLSLGVSVATQPTVSSKIKPGPERLFVGWDTAAIGTLNVVEGGSLSAGRTRLGNGIGGQGTLNIGYGTGGGYMVTHRLEVGYNLVLGGIPVSGGNGVVNLGGNSVLHAGSMLFGQEAEAYGQFPETVGEGVVNMADEARLMVGGDLVADGRAATWVANGWVQAVDDQKVVAFRYVSESNRTVFHLTFNFDFVDQDGDGINDSDEDTGSVYALVFRMLTWDEAKADAEVLGGHLATITSEKEHHAIVRALGENWLEDLPMWIGATDRNAEGTWQWITGEPFDYERWFPRQPDDFAMIDSFGEDHLGYWRAKRWNDFSGQAVLPYLIEYEAALDPLNPDTDGDGLNDGDEVKIHGTSPCIADTDNDGINDGDEVTAGLDPLASDSDRDGLDDSTEPALGLDPLNPDADGDGLRDGDELDITATDPQQPDSSTNGINDLVVIETIHGTNLVDRLALHYTSTWSNAPSGVVLFTVGTGSRISYTLEVQQPGIYHLGFQTRFDTVAGAPDALAPRLQLEIDGHEFGRFPSNIPGNLPEYSLFTPWLSAGTHTLTVTPRGAGYTGAFTIESIEIGTIDGGDANDNGIPDWMENQINQGQDTDGDGISDYDEVNLYGTDTLNADTDGDGLEDGDELEYGTDLLDEDSDDDGVFDGAEVYESRTNPLEAEFDGTVDNVVVVSGSQFTTNCTGDVRTEADGVCIRPMRGSLEYALDVPQSDLYRLSISAAHEWLSERVPDESRLEIYLDGVYIDSKVLGTASLAFEDVLLFLPWLTQGQHTINVVWDNYDKKCSLLVQEVRLQTLGGSDADSDGLKDWVEVYLDAVTGVDSMRESVVSPACIEGDALYVPFMQIQSLQDAGDTNVPQAASLPLVKQGVGDRWYSNLPLEKNGTTEAEASFQNGGIIRDISVEWVAFDLSEHDGEELTIRTGDSVKFASDGQPFDLTVGPDSYPSTNGAPLVVLFDEAATYAVGDGTISISVDVVGGNFPTNSPACMPHRSRDWLCLDLPTNVVVEADDTVELVQGVEIVEGWETNATLHAPCPLLTLTASITLGEHWLVARLFEGGPILDNIRIDTCWSGWPAGSAQCVALYDDMSVWEFTLNSRDLPGGVTLEIESIVAGVVFADSFGTSITITATDFNEQDEYKYQLAIPMDVNTAACHIAKMYQDGVYIGTAYSTGEFVPGT